MLENRSKLYLGVAAAALVMLLGTFLPVETVEIHGCKLMAYLSLLRVEVKAAQAAHQAQQRAEAETEAVAMAENTRAAAVAQTTQKPAAPGLDISLMIPVWGALVAVVAEEDFPAMVQMKQTQSVAVYRMVEKEEHKTIRPPGLPVAVREAVVVAQVVLMVTAALAALAKCIFVFIFKGV